MSTVDFKKTLEHYRARPGELRLLDVPDMRQPVRPAFSAPPEVSS